MGSDYVMTGIFIFFFLTILSVCIYVIYDSKSVYIEDDCIAISVDNDGNADKLSTGINTGGPDIKSRIIVLPEESEVNIIDSCVIDNNTTVNYSFTLGYRNILNDKQYEKLKKLNIAVKSNYQEIAGSLYNSVDNDLKREIITKANSVIKSLLTTNKDLGINTNKLSNSLLNNLKTQLEEYGIENLSVSNLELIIN